MLPSDKVTKLIAKSVLVVGVALDFNVFAWEVLFQVAQACLIAAVAIDLNVDIDLVDNKSFCIVAMVLASVVAPTRSRSNLVSGNMRSILYIRMLAISWLALVMTHKVSVTHQASCVHSIAPSVKNL